MKYRYLVGTLIVSLISVQTARAGAHLPLEGKWISWDLVRNAPVTNGLLTMEFSTAESTVIWRTLDEGRIVTRDGTFTVQSSANLLHPSTTTFILIINPKTADYPRDSLIHLGTVEIREDNRVPSNDKALHFHSFYSDFVLIRQ